MLRQESQHECEIALASFGDTIGRRHFFVLISCSAVPTVNSLDNTASEGSAQDRIDDEKDIERELRAVVARISALDMKASRSIPDGYVEMPSVEAKQFLLQQVRQRLDILERRDGTHAVEKYLSGYKHEVLTRDFDVVHPSPTGGKWVPIIVTKLVRKENKAAIGSPASLPELSH